MNRIIDVSQARFPSVKVPIDNGGGNAAVGDVSNGKTFSSANGLGLTGTGANFGNAAVGDVLSGKTFSSANGTLITGTGANAKNYASGTMTSSAGSSTFTFDNGTTTNQPSVTVPFSSIGFTPAYIELTNGVDHVVYSEVSVGTNSASKISEQGSFYRLVSPAVVDGTGFVLPVAGASTVYTWKAWGP